MLQEATKNISEGTYGFKAFHKLFLDNIDQPSLLKQCLGTSKSDLEDEGRVAVD